MEDTEGCGCALAAFVVLILFCIFGIAFLSNNQAKVDLPTSKAEATTKAEPEPELNRKFRGATWAFCVADYNNDGTPDLWIIKRSGTETGKLEVHILNGKNLNEWMIHGTTAMHECVDEKIVPLPFEIEKLP